MDNITILTGSQCQARDGVRNISLLPGFGIAFTREVLHNQVPSTPAVAQRAPRYMSVLGLIAEDAA